MDIRKLSKGNTAAKGFEDNQVKTHSDPGSTNLTDEERSAIDKGTPDELDDEMIQEYLQFLKEQDISEEQIHQVLDTLIANGTIKWSFTILGKIPVIFTCRPAWINTLVLDRVQENPPKTYSAFSDLVNTCNLAGSLVQYGNAKFEATDEASFDAVKKYIQNLPFTLKAQLIRQLAIFDRVVAVATSDWAVENFMKPSPVESAQTA